MSYRTFRSPAKKRACGRITDGSDVVKKAGYSAHKAYICPDDNSVAGIVLYRGIHHKQSVVRASPGIADRPSGACSKSKDHTVLNEHSSGRGDIDPDEPCCGTVNREITQLNDLCVGRARTRVIHVDSIGTGRQDRAEGAAAVNGDRLGDGYRAEAAWIDAIYFAAVGGLGNRARECLAGGGAAAWVCVVTDAGNPGTSCLRLGKRSKREHEDRDC